MSPWKRSLHFIYTFKGLGAGGKENHPSAPNHPQTWVLIPPPGCQEQKSSCLLYFITSLDLQPLQNYVGLLEA